MQSDRHFEVRLRRSGAGRARVQRLTLLGLGLRHVGQAVFLRDTPAVRGMIYRVVHLVDVVPRTGNPPPSARQRARRRLAERASSAAVPAAVPAAAPAVAAAAP